METSQPLWAACDTTWLWFWGKKMLLLHLVWIWVFPLILLPCSAVKSPTPFLQWPSCMWWRLLLGMPDAISASAWTSLYYPRVSSQGRSSSPRHLGDLQQTLLQVFNISLAVTPVPQVLFFRAAPQPVSLQPVLLSYSFPFVLSEIHRVPVSSIPLDGIPALTCISSSPSNLVFPANLAGVKFDKTLTSSLW